VVWRPERGGGTERGREEGFGGVVCLARIPVSTEALFAYFHWMELEKKIKFFLLTVDLYPLNPFQFT
jgi:hypothetical protein